MAKTQQQPTDKGTKKTKRTINRSEAANKVVAELNGQTTLGELAKKVDVLIVADGGPSRVEVCAHHVRLALQTAKALGIVKLTYPKDIIVERVK